MIVPAFVVVRPTMLLVALAAALVVYLYWRPIRPPRVSVTRPHLWQQVLGAPQASTSRWRRRRLLSAGIHSTVILLLAGAVASPCWQRPRTVVFVVDNSASMEATDGGVSRLAKARARVRNELESVGPREFVALVTTAGTPVVLVENEQSHPRIDARLDRIVAIDLPSHLIQAVDLAKTLAVAGTRPEVHVLSDGCSDGLERVRSMAGVTVHGMGTHAGNVGLARLAVRRPPATPGRFQAVVAIVNHSDNPVAVPIRIELEDENLYAGTCELEADSTLTTVLDLQSPVGGTLVALLDRSDALPDDNRLATVLPTGTAEADSDCSIACQAVGDPRSTAGWTDASVDKSAPKRAGMALETWLLLAALFLAAAEWPLYHRRWTC